MSFLDPKKTEVCWTPQIATTRKERSQSRGTQKPKRTRKVSRRGKERRGGGEGHPSRSSFLDAVKEATHPRKTFLDAKNSLGANPLKANFVHANARPKAFLGSRKKVNPIFSRFWTPFWAVYRQKMEKNLFCGPVANGTKKTTRQSPPAANRDKNKKRQNYQIRREKSPIFTDSG